MLNLNELKITGNVTKAPETRNVRKTSVTRARLMHNDTYRKDDGSTVERLAAIDLEIWGKSGEAFAEHVTTKTPVFVQGALQLDQWEQDGEPRSRLVVRVHGWQFLLPKSDTSTESDTETKGRGAKGNGKSKSAAAA